MASLTVNVKDAPYGAVGDGVTDDRAAIQAAADFLVNNGGGGVLFFPNGTYLCKRAPLLTVPYGDGISPHSQPGIDGNYSVRIPNVGSPLSPVAGMTLQGESLAAVIKQDDVYTVPIYFAFPDIPSQGNVTVTNLKFKGNTSVTTLALAASGGGGAAALLGFTGGPASYFARKIRVQNCHFEDGNKQAALFLSGLEDVLVDGCSFVHFKDYFVATAVTAATTGNITLSGTQTVDGVGLIAGDRVLVKDQSTSAQNGIYVAAIGSWSRASDASTYRISRSPKSRLERLKTIGENCLDRRSRKCMMSATS
jgi:hypothetical protein